MGDRAARATDDSDPIDAEEVSSISSERVFCMRHCKVAEEVIPRRCFGDLFMAR